MKLIRIDLDNLKHVRDFLNLPFHIYRNTPQWVPPLMMDERRRLDRKKYPFHQHSEAAFFLVYKNNDPVGRLAILDNKLHNEYNHERTAFFYLFETENDLEITHLLFDAAFSWAKKQGLKRVFGPRGFTALDGYGLLINGFDRRPALGLPYNHPYYPGMLDSIGFQPEEDIASGYLAADLQFPDRIHALAARIKERRGLEVLQFRTRHDLQDALKYLEELYNRVMAGSNGGTPITHEEINALSDQLLWFADPTLIKIIIKDQHPVGFLLAYPDISRALQVSRGRLFPLGWLRMLLEAKKTEWININGAGLIPEYQGAGGTAILYNELFTSVRQKPRYKHAEVVQIGVKNYRMQRELENFGVKFYKTHRTYSVSL